MHVPTGVVSKKERGDLSTARNAVRNIFRLANSPATLDNFEFFLELYFLLEAR